MAAVTCPFCGLTCDDLGLDEHGVDTRGCPKAASNFARALGEAQHAIDGRPATLTQAAAAAADILRRARLPLFAGLATDIAGIRELLALADRVGAVADHRHSAAFLRNLAVVQTEGWVTATFAEIANRADVMLIVGQDPARNYPRFFERLIRNSRPLYRTGPPYVAFLGAAALAPTDPVVEAVLTVEPDRLLDALGILRLLLRARTPRLAEISGIPVAGLAAFGETLRSARYGAVIWDAGAFASDMFAPEMGELAVKTICDIVRRLNRTTRCVGLPLGGDDNAQGAIQAMLWQTGWPSRVSFAGGAPQYDAWLNDADRLIAAREVDALLWVSALAPDPPRAADLPTIALVGADHAGLPTTPDVEIRVGTPALDHGGTVMRGDALVALPLLATRSSTLPSVAEAVRTIATHLVQPVS